MDNNDNTSAGGENGGETPIAEIRKKAIDLIYAGQYKILWHHIHSCHPDITEIEVLNTLAFGIYSPDKEIRGRYISWAKFPYRAAWIRAVFEFAQSRKGEIVLVITAFEEEKT